MGVNNLAGYSVLVGEWNKQVWRSVSCASDAAVMYEGRLCELAECVCTETQMDIDIYGEAPDKLTYTEQANKRTNCKRLTWYILCVNLLLQILNESAVI